MAVKITLKDVEKTLSNMNSSDSIKYINSIKDECSFNVEKLCKKYQKKLENEIKEATRYAKMLEFEKEAYKLGFINLCGIDEAGRGPLAGPVVAACVILPKDIFIEGVNDSKKLSPSKRERLFDEITKNAIAYGVGIVDEKVIDNINILNSTKQAMITAINSMQVKPDYLLIDAENIKYDLPQKAIIEGDAKSISIAAASIIAKVTRDQIMDEVDQIYPEYNFKKNKGYGTKEHIDKIKEIGICPIHRKSFTKNFV